MTPTTEEVRALLARLQMYSETDDYHTMGEIMREAAALCESWLAREGAERYISPAEARYDFQYAPREAQDDQRAENAKRAEKIDMPPLEAHPKQDDELVARLQSGHAATPHITGEATLYGDAADRLAAQAQEIAELRIELGAALAAAEDWNEDDLPAKEKATAYRNSFWNERKRAVAAEAALAEARKDAERLDYLERSPRLAEIHIEGEGVKDCYLYGISGAPGLKLREIIDSARTAIARGEGKPQS